VGLFTWLFGRKEGAATAARRENEGLPSPGTEAHSKTTKGDRRTPPGPEAENLRRWRESGQARAWVEAHHGRWGHEEWLALLSSLERSPYWPMQPEAVGIVLEEEKRERLKRN
jgi:hypothetical protein